LLPVGGSEFFGALLAEELASPKTNAENEFQFGDERQLFICGTASKAANHLFRSARKTKVPVFTMPQELMWGNDFSPGAREAIAERVTEGFEKSKRVVLGVGLPHVHDVKAARRLSANLVDVAEVVLKNSDIKYIFAEGGATSAELVRRMKWSRLEVRREWAPGVATLAVATENPLWLTIKPGSYSWPPAWTGEA
jgi:uncharacterized protein YgbK (DUF1537 family)